MKVKPYTGEKSLESVIRTIVDALTAKLTVRDNVAGEQMTVAWNSDAIVTISPARQPRSIIILRAHRLDTPAAFASGGAVYWEPLTDGRIQLTGMSSLAGSIDWSVDLLLLED